MKKLFLGTLAALGLLVGVLAVAVAVRFATAGRLVDGQDLNGLGHIVKAGRPPS